MQNKRDKGHCVLEAQCWSLTGGGVLKVVLARSEKRGYWSQYSGAALYCMSQAYFLKASVRQWTLKIFMELFDLPFYIVLKGAVG